MQRNLPGPSLIPFPGDILDPNAGTGLDRFTFFESACWMCISTPRRLRGGGTRCRHEQPLLPNHMHPATCFASTGGRLDLSRGAPGGIPGLRHVP